MKQIVIFTLLLLGSMSVMAQKVFVTSGTKSSFYHKRSDCQRLKSVGSPAFSVSIEQAKSLGKSPCTSCYSTGTNETRMSKNANNESYNAQSIKNNVQVSNIELPNTAKGTKSQIIKHIGYTTSYNSSWLIPNWVAYCLTAKEVAGTLPRPKMQFEPDPLIKGKSAVHGDYSNSGYSRGHMAPAADMKWSQQALIESFYLSNICPQKAELNGGVWERLENRCRTLASESDLYICCGPIVSASPKRIGDNKVAVPDGFFKVLCMKRKGKWQAIGFLFPNSECKGSMFDYACSVDEVENKTGHDFFFNLSDNIEATIESIYKRKDWQ